MCFWAPNLISEMRLKRNLATVCLQMFFPFRHRKKLVTRIFPIFSNILWEFPCKRFILRHFHFDANVFSMIYWNCYAGNILLFINHNKETNIHHSIGNYIKYTHAWSTVSIYWKKSDVNFPYYFSHFTFLINNNEIIACSFRFINKVSKSVVRISIVF